MVVTSVPSEDHDYYELATYWNVFGPVVKYQNRRATGDPDQRWCDHLNAAHGPFKRALILNCGNGWVERDLLRDGIIGSAVGIDISEELLASARQEAAAGDLALEYRRVDINLDPLPEGPFDLVVNYAAAHHIARIDAVFRQICERLLETDGVFVSVDYVGPHRNQYTGRQWDAAWQANQALPEDLRHAMAYPHLPTMLVGDPTEAVHSELILPTLRRYFAIEHERSLGGGIAYLVLTHNAPFYNRSHLLVEPHVETLIALDEAFTDEAPGETLFAYVVARPDPASLADKDQLARWAAEEEAREVAGAANGGRYYPPTMLETLHYGERRAISHPQVVPALSLPMLRAGLVNRFPSLGRRYREAKRLVRERRPGGSRPARG